MTRTTDHATEQRGLDPQALEAAAEGWDNRLQAAMLGLAVLATALYPLLLGSLVSLVGDRVVGWALALLALAATGHALVSVRKRRGPVAPVVARSGVALLALANAAGESLLPLLLVPGWIYGCLAWAFFASLREGAGDGSLIERVIRQVQPVAPGFIAPYCRKVTAVWGLVMAVNAAVLTVVALAASAETWSAVAGKGLWIWMGGVSLVEFLVRKTYFRNYWYRGPFERVWERLFPAEDTEMGRRSAAYIRMVREQMDAHQDRDRDRSSPAQ